MNKLVLFIIICISGISFADIPEIDFGGEARFRTTYLSETEEYETDLKGNLSIEISGDSGFYQSTLLEIGSVNLNDETKIYDFLEVETKELFFGYKNSFLDSKIGLIDVKTPKEIIYSGEDLGLQLKLEMDDLEFKGFYALPNIIDDTLTVLDDFSQLNHLIYLGLEYKDFHETDLKLWATYFQDNDEKDYSYYSAWIGLEIEKQIKNLDTEIGVIYNLGEVADKDIPLNSWLGYMELSLDIDKKSKLFSRINITMNSNGEDTINQFQSVDGDGVLNTGLSLFSEDYSDLDNLSTNDLIYEDLGVFFYEIGYRREFKTIPLNSEIILGGANSGMIFNGFELDINNNFQITKHLELNLDTALIFLAEEDDYSLKCYLEHSF